MKNLTIHFKTCVDPLLQDLFDGKASAELIRQLSERVDDLPKMISIDIEDRTASGARELWIVLKPTEALFELMAAVAG